MVNLIWTSPAFLFLETLPESQALGIFRQVEMLRVFPQMGGPLPSRKKAYSKYRQLIYRKHHRIIYEFDETDNTVYVSAVQNCKQRLPSPRNLRRQIPDSELPLE